VIHADVLSRIDKNLVYFDVTWPSGVSVSYDGVPFMVAGRKEYQCASGPARHCKSASSAPSVSRL